MRGVKPQALANQVSGEATRFRWPAAAALATELGEMPSAWDNWAPETISFSKVGLAMADSIKAVIHITLP